MKIITAVELKKIYNKKGVVIIDVRDAPEFFVGAIPGAINIPLDSFEDKVLEKLLDKKVVFHCQGGGRSAQAMEKIEKKFGKEIFELEEGFNSWVEAGGEIEKRVSAGLPIMRQVQMIAGSLVVLGVVMSIYNNAAWIGLSVFVGFGLFFAGLTGWCGMATLLKAMPWNKK